MKNGWLFFFLALVLSTSSGLAQPQFFFQTNNNVLKIIDFWGSVGPTLEIPSETNGYPVTGIGDYMFQNHSEVTNVIIPASITNLGYGVFWGCTGIKSFDVDPGNPAFASVNGVLFDVNETSLIAFTGGRGGTYSIPNSVTNINAVAFYFCTNLTGISLGNVVTIGDEAFENCYRLNGVTLPGSTKSIGNAAFAYCYGIQNLVIPDGVTNIGNGAFGGCAFLTNVVIPPSVVTLGSGAFSHTALQSVIVPGSVADISAFSGCANLTNVVIGQGVKSIGAYAFQGCSSLRSIALPDGIAHIGEEAFSGTKLTRIVIPDSTTNIDGWAFQNIPSLTNAIIGSGVANIGESAFRTYPGSTNITSFFFKGNAPTPAAGDSIFGGYDNAKVYYLPDTAGWWDTNFSGLPAVLWNPEIKLKDGRFGVKTNRFGFSIMGTGNIPIVVEAKANLSGAWTQLLSCNLTNGSIYFTDPQWTNFPGRFYRIRSP